ncbi:MAG: hypothetical protein WA689_23645, partial [Trebonia sp.]
FAGWARPAGVAAAGLLAARRAPFPVLVVVAAAVTALLRLAGIQLSERARGSSGPQRPGCGGLGVGYGWGDGGVRSG